MIAGGKCRNKPRPRASVPGDVVDYHVKEGEQLCGSEVVVGEYVDLGEKLVVAGVLLVGGYALAWPVESGGCDELALLGVLWVCDSVGSGVGDAPEVAGPLVAGVG